MKHAIIYLLLSLLIISCTAEKKFLRESPRIRVFEEWKGQNFHKPLELKIGWYKYKESGAIEDSSNLWAVAFKDSGKVYGSSPILMVSYPDSTDGIYFDMDVDDALLGKLIKHSLMTQLPIKRPFKEFFATADCASCHPSAIKVKGVNY
jgi:hypothetical protein